MKVGKNEKSLVLSSTDIPDIFFTEYLPEASGDNTKVLLYIQFLSKYNKEFKVNDLSKTLGLDFNVVQDALKYWEEKGLIIKTPDGYNLADIQEIELSKIYTPKVTASPEDVKKGEDNKNRNQAIENINNMFFQGVMSTSWYNDIYHWFEKYGFDDNVMLALFSYAAEKRALHRNYIQATADAWAKNNIKTFVDLDEYFGKQEKRNDLSKEITKKLKLFRKLTLYEEEDIVKWTENYGFGMNVIEIALKKASQNNRVRFDYIDALLTDWHKKELMTPEEVNTYLKSMNTKEREKTKKSLTNQQSFEFTQSTFDNLDSLFDN